MWCDVAAATALPPWRRLGVGVSSWLCVGVTTPSHDVTRPAWQQPSSLSSPRCAVRAARQLPAGCTLAVLPDSALWGVNAFADADVGGGLTPHPADFVAALLRASCARDVAVDVAYMAHCLALRCYTHPSCYFTARVRAYDAADDAATEACVRAWLAVVAEDAATAPLSCVAAAQRYVHACALHRMPSSDKDKKDAAAAQQHAQQRCSLVIAPLLDLLMCKHDDDATNVTLCAATAADARAALSSHVRGARQYLRHKDDAYRYWLLRSTRDVATGEVLRLPRLLT